MEHTPGKWFFQNNTADDREGFEVLSDDGRSKWFAVADVMPNHFGTEEVSLEQAEANARLIAAAPELLAALETLVPICQNILLRFQDQMSPADRAGRTSQLRMCEEVLERLGVDSYSGR